MFARHQCVERPGLRDRAWKSVQQKSAAATDATSAFADEIEHGFVGNDIAALHVAECGFERGAARAFAKMFGGAEDVAGREMACTEPFAEQFRLRALAHARRAEEHQA